MTPRVPVAGDWRLAVLAAAPAVLLLAFQATYPWPFFSDDAFISLRYAERLLDGHGLTWTDGPDGRPEHVEGYSNLSWVLLVAMLGAVGIDLVDAARLCGAVATMLALWLLARALAPKDLRTTLVAAVPPLLVAASQPVLAWTLGGLEGPLVLLLLAWGFGAIARVSYAGVHAKWPPRRLLRLGVPFALLCWTRPDGPLWALTAGVAVAFLPQGIAAAKRAATALWFGAPAIAATLLQLAFRLAVYGDVVPNTAHVKAELDPGSFAAGFDYVRAALAVSPGLSALALAGIALVAWRARPRAVALVALLPLLAWALYLVAIGGDHFPGRRLWHGALAPLALAAGLGLRALGSGTIATAGAMALGLTAAFADASTARRDAQSQELRQELWEWRGKTLGEALGKAFADERPLLAVEAAGALPYYSRLPALDLLGLCDRTIATTPFPAWLDTVVQGTPKPPGHLRGNGAYVMERAPDLMLFSNPPGLPLPVFVSGCELEGDPRFLDGYRCVLVALEDAAILPDHQETLVAPLWVRLDGRAGVRRNDARVDVPAMLFDAFRLPGPVQRRYQQLEGTAAAERAAHLGAVVQWYTARSRFAVPRGDDLALVLPPGTEATLSLELTAGRWRARVLPEAPGATARIVGADVDGDARFVVAKAGAHTVVLAAGDAVARPTRVVLERAPD